MYNVPCLYSSATTSQMCRPSPQNERTSSSILGNATLFETGLNISISYLKMIYDFPTLSFACFIISGSSSMLQSKCNTLQANY